MSKIDLSKKELKSEVNNDGIIRYYYKVKPGHWHPLAQDVYIAAISAKLLREVEAMKIIQTVDLIEE